jgi:hypothetical protein
MKKRFSLITAALVFVVALFVGAQLNTVLP